MNLLRLWFDQTQFLQLSKAEFYNAGTKELRISTRGKVPTVATGGSFAWTSAVRALAILLVKAKITALGKLSESSAISTECISIAGGQGTPAASLDHAISKAPAWLVDLFGTDIDGRSRAHRLFHRVNPERKRPGPVQIILNTKALDPDRIELFVNGHPASQSTIIEGLLAGLLGEEQMPVAAEPSHTHLLQRPFVASLPAMTEFSFQSLRELDEFFGEIHSQMMPLISQAEPLVGQLRHAWWPIITASHRQDLRQDDEHRPIAYSVYGRTKIDRWVSLEYKKRSARIYNGPSDGLGFDFWIYGDVTAQIFVPPTTTQRIEDHFNGCSEISEFDILNFQKECLDGARGAKLLLLRNKTLAEELRRQVFNRGELTDYQVRG